MFLARPIITLTGLELPISSFALIGMGKADSEPTFADVIL